MIGRNSDGEVGSDSLSSKEMSSNGIKASAITNTISSNLHPPVDKGKHAFQYLVAMFTIETFLWGFAGSFGVLLSFYEEDPSSRLYRDPNAKVLLSIVGTINTGIIAAAAPFVSFWIVKAPAIRRRLMLLGVVTCVMSLLLSSYSTSALHVLLTQGIGYATGGSVLYFSALSHLPEWFEERRGFANGVIFSGTGLGGSAFPLMLNGLLSSCGPEWALRIIAALFAIVTLPAVYFIRPRVSISEDGHSIDTPECVFTCEKEAPPRPRFFFGALFRCLPVTFWVYVFANVLQSTAFYLPGLYLPSYMHSLGRSPVAGGAIVSLLNGVSIFAQLAGGALSDHFSPHLIGTISSIIGGASVLVFWGVLGQHGVAWLFTFSVVYGFSAGGWTSLYFSVLKHFTRDPASVLPAYGLLSLTRGIGNMLAGPVSSALVPSNTDDQSHSSTSPAGCFSRLIWFIGILLLIDGLIESFLWLYLQVTTRAPSTFVPDEMGEMGNKILKLNSKESTLG